MLLLSPLSAAERVLGPTYGALLFLFVSRVKNKRELNASLKGATLGDPDADGDDTLNWIKKSKKREKMLAKKRMQELENMDKQFQEEYTESMCFSDKLYLSA